MLKLTPFLVRAFAWDFFPGYLMHFCKLGKYPEGTAPLRPSLMEVRNACAALLNNGMAERILPANAAGVLGRYVQQLSRMTETEASWATLGEAWIDCATGEDRARASIAAAP